MAIPSNRAGFQPKYPTKLILGSFGKDNLFITISADLWLERFHQVKDVDSLLDISDLLPDRRGHIFYPAWNGGLTVDLVSDKTLFRITERLSGSGLQQVACGADGDALEQGTPALIISAFLHSPSCIPPGGPEVSSVLILTHSGVKTSAHPPFVNC